MYHMKQATVRDLRYDFKKIERLLRQGEELEITKHGRVIARLLPSNNGSPLPMPDFLGRLRAIYGDQLSPVTGAESIAQGRRRY